MPTSDIFDLSLVEQFGQRARRLNMRGADFLLHHLSLDLLARLEVVKRRFSYALNLHNRTDLVRDMLRESGKINALTCLELPTYSYKNGEDNNKREGENLNLPYQQADLIISLGQLHLTNDTPGILAQICHALQPDGLFIAALAGQGTLAELRESFIQAESDIYGGVSPRVIPFMDVRDAGSLMQRAGFALPVTDSQNILVRYDDIFALMRDLRAMGMQNALISRSRKPVSKRFFTRANEIYTSRFCDADGRIRATFSFIWLTGWAPHPAQQKPSKPGSATVLLDRVLRQF